jgi:hypothetical protein
MANKEKNDPCWDGYRQYGMKKKKGKMVPNCVPEERMSFSQFVESMELHEFIEEDFEPTGDELYEDWGEELQEAEYKGRKIKLGKPFLTPGGPKKRAVYVKNDKGNVVKVNFGDPNLSVKKHIPARRKSFRARHGCDVNPGPKHKAKYWSCRQW